MPENYIALFKTPNKNESLEIIEQAQQPILNTIEYIRGNLSFPEPEITLKDKLNSSFINTIFVHSKKFHVTNACISCGKCENICPLGNIKLLNGKPNWGEHCTYCMACICRCPKEAIEYGKHSKDMARYTCPK